MKLIKWLTCILTKDFTRIDQANRRMIDLLMGKEEKRFIGDEKYFLIKLSYKETFIILNHETRKER